MYKAFYGLSRNPFEVSPDPYFFYPTPHHNEALATLTYGVYRKKGFVVITGEVGTGKTLLIRFLLEALNRNRIASAFVCNPRLSVLEFLTHILSDLQVSPVGQTKREMLLRLGDYLVARSRAGGTTALLIDEAQLLDWELLEEIRLLTNLETSQQKLLQIVLVGQPELDQKLDSWPLRQLKQRIGLRCRLEPLSREELKGYVRWRLELAGASVNAAAIYPDETIAAIHKCSRGIPRLVNTLCENCLIAGFSDRTTQITPKIVEEVAFSFRMDLAPRAPENEPESEDPSRLLKRLFGVIDEMRGNSDHATVEASLVSERGPQ